MYGTRSRQREAVWTEGLVQGPEAYGESRGVVRDEGRQDRQMAVVLLDGPDPVRSRYPGILQSTIPAGVLLQGQQAVCGDHELPVHRLQEADICLYA